MKTVSVLSITNNPDIVKQSQLDFYNSPQCQFKVAYTPTALREITSQEEAAIVLPLVVTQLQQQVKQGASAVLIFAFGEIAIKEGRNLVSVPVMEFGRLAIQTAATICRNKFTVIPTKLSMMSFIDQMVESSGVKERYLSAQHEVGYNPADLKKPEAFEPLVAAVNAEIERGVDTFTFGCAGFIGVIDKLKSVIHEQHGPRIQLVDPIATTLAFIKTLI